MLKILIIDNHDSFTYNLVEVLRSTGLCEVQVILLENAIELKNFQNFHGIILSPGPGLPHEKNGLNSLISRIQDKPLLGVCLGHQAIAQYFGATIYQLDRIVHGEATAIKVNDNLLYNGLNNKFSVGRYHSWAIIKENFPEELEITSETDSEIIMSYKHKSLNIFGVQFHPESILTPNGKQILKNWLINCVKNHLPEAI